MVKWLTNEGAKFLIQMNQELVVDPILSYFKNQTSNETESANIEVENADNEEEEVVEDRFFPCDNEVHLYVLKQHFLQSNNFTGEYRSSHQENGMKKWYFNTIKNFPNFHIKFFQEYIHFSANFHSIFTFKVTSN